jgi:hypothetical protein
MAPKMDVKMFYFVFCIIMTQKKLVQSFVIPHFFIVIVIIFIRVFRWKSIEDLTWHLICMQDTFLVCLGTGVFLYILRNS